MKIEFKNISRQFEKVKALNNCNLTIEEDKFTLIKGASGSGKSTLLYILGGLLKPSSGELIVDGESLYSGSQSKQNNFRRDRVGFIFQSFQLLPYLTVEENIVSSLIGDVTVTKEELKDRLKEVGLEDRYNHLPSQLSAGEEQRVALLRAIIKDPDIILADEPTGNLDPENSKIIVELLEKFKNRGGTVVMVSHGLEADSYADRVVTLNAGAVVSN